MGDQQQQPRQQVQVTLSLRTSPPHTISIHNADPAEPLKLIASVRQTASPFPDRAITLLTKYSCLDATPGEDAFFWRAMSPPKFARGADDENDNASCLTPELPLQPPQRISGIRVSGDPDLLKRPTDDGFTFITVPSVGKGQTEVTFELWPSRLVRRLGNKDETVEDKMKRFLRPEDTYKIAAAKLGVNWWTFGSLEGEDGLLKKKIARWTFPDDLSLVREPGDDETDDVAHSLRDLVDLHNVNSLSSRSAVEGEQRPVVREMRGEGWVFGEPEAGLDMVREPAEREASFTIVE
ncbi:hypothetical protein F4782DRAFT_515643 [Xylaria castorea]|nr:hypothetical protein F4782DRAFT_515643 [Xylaria castorea]